MGFTTPVNLGTTAPTCITLGASATCTKAVRRKTVEWARAMGPEGKHGQSKPKRYKCTITAEGKGTITRNTTRAGTSEATAIIDRFKSGSQLNEEFDGWSVEAHYYTAPA